MFIPDLQPLIANLVAEAIPRADAHSAAAAASIGHDRAFATVEDLRRIDTATLVIAGDDIRHPECLAHSLATVLPQGSSPKFRCPANLSTLRTWHTLSARRSRTSFVEHRTGTLGSMKTRH